MTAVVNSIMLCLKFVQCSSGRVGVGFGFGVFVLAHVGYLQVVVLETVSLSCGLILPAYRRQFDRFYDRSGFLSIDFSAAFIRAL